MALATGLPNRRSRNAPAVGAVPVTGLLSRLLPLATIPESCFLANSSSLIPDVNDHPYRPVHSRSRIRRKASCGVDSTAPGLLSHLYRQGKWFHGGELWTDWTGGFLAGMMWQFHRRTNDGTWRERAEHYSRLLEHRQHDRKVHDLGFIFLNTYLPWFELPVKNNCTRS